MDRFARAPLLADISAAILEAPGWARVGITAPGEQLRERASEELARTIVTRLAGPAEAGDNTQLSLAI